MESVQAARRRRLLYPLLGLALALALVPLFLLARRSTVPPLEAAEIQNGDFGAGLADWNVKMISAAAETEVVQEGRSRRFARLKKPANWKISAYMGQTVNVRRLQAGVPVRIAADFRIPPGGGPAAIHVDCIDTDAAQTEEAGYGQLLVTEPSSPPADGAWHTQEVDLIAPAGTNQLRVFISVDGDASVDVTAVKLTTTPKQ